jgi:hypothetical protein
MRVCCLLCKIGSLKCWAWIAGGVVLAEPYVNAEVLAASVPDPFYEENVFFGVSQHVRRGHVSAIDVLFDPR